jgi:hypothetical protein
MREYIAESSKKAKEGKKVFKLFGHILVQLESNLPHGVDIEAVLVSVKERLPKHLLDDVDAIYIGNFKMLNDRSVDSMFVDGSILIKSNHESNEALFDTMMHEFAHAIEVKEKDYIYGSGDIVNEFISKRKLVYHTIKDDYEIDKKLFLDPNFNQVLDTFFADEIGYSNLGVITSNIFMSPYAITSVREYFANGFEHYFIDGIESLEKISPILASKIKKILSSKNKNS